MKTKSHNKKKIEIILERNDGLLWGRVENAGNFMPTPYGKSTGEVIKNLKSLVQDYVKNEGISDKFWSKLDMDNVEFTFSYDLQAYFQEHDYLKITSVANRAGLNPGLVRQYASGVKYPSDVQADKLRVAINVIAKELMRHSIYVA